MPPKVVCIVGPTGCGKTGLGVALAERLGGEVVSCDSMQIYKHMDIGTAKPTKEEMEGVHHHLLDMVEPGEDFSAGKYVQLADSCVQDILSRGKTAVIAGGTGLSPCDIHGCIYNYRKHYCSISINQKNIATTPFQIFFRHLNHLGNQFQTFFFCKHLLFFHTPYIFKR